MTDNDVRPDDLPPDPDKYDSPRAQLARARGLDAPYIPGGGSGSRNRRTEDRYYGRLLVIMVVVIVAAGFVLGIIANLMTAAGS